MCFDDHGEPHFHADYGEPKANAAALAPELFGKVRVEYGMFVWPGDVDLSPEFLGADCESGRVITWKQGA
jgi:hypothetical protein